MLPGDPTSAVSGGQRVFSVPEGTVSPCFSSRPLGPGQRVKQRAWGLRDSEREWAVGIERGLCSFLDTFLPCLSLPGWVAFEVALALGLVLDVDVSNLIQAVVCKDLLAASYLTTGIGENIPRRKEHEFKAGRCKDALCGWGSGPEFRVSLHWCSLDLANAAACVGHRGSPIPRSARLASLTRSLVPL